MAIKSSFLLFESSAVVGADLGDGLQEIGKCGLRPACGQSPDPAEHRQAPRRVRLCHARRVRENLADILDIVRGAQILGGHIPHRQRKSWFAAMTRAGSVPGSLK